MKKTIQEKIAELRQREKVERKRAQEKFMHHLHKCAMKSAPQLANLSPIQLKKFFTQHVGNSYGKGVMDKILAAEAKS
jgi:predicted ATPase